MPRTKQTPEGKAIELLAKSFADDAGYRQTWAANIAMVIFDNWPAKGRKIERCNLCADKILQHIFGPKPS